jgi:hypothetical protein
VKYLAAETVEQAAFAIKRIREIDTLQNRLIEQDDQCLTGMPASTTIGHWHNEYGPQPTAEAAKTMRAIFRDDLAKQREALLLELYANHIEPPGEQDA